MSWTKIGNVFPNPKSKNPYAYRIKARCGECNEVKTPACKCDGTILSQRCQACAGRAGLAHARAMGLVDPVTRLQHGHARKGQMSADYMRYRSMIARCHNPNAHDYCDYGERGIEVCDEWRGNGGFERYLFHVGPKPGPGFSVERIKNELGYRPGNVRWATPLEQGANKRNNVLITRNGRTQHASAWARELGMSPQLIIARERQGLSAEDVLAKEDRRGGSDPGCIKYRGMAKTTTEWARIAGISPKLLCKRLRTGWTMAEALSPSSRKKK
jgi:hypothetical protein